MSGFAPQKEFVVRLAATEDLDALLNLYEEVAAEGRYIAAEAPVDREKRRPGLLEFIQGDDGAMFVAELEGEIIGSVSVGGTGLVHLGMMVAKAHRRFGIGSALLRACVDWAREVGAYKITLEVWPHNTAAIALYEKFGFEREGLLRKHWRRQSGELWDSVVMGLLLDAE